jgi:hypothetical protein
MIWGAGGSRALKSFQWRHEKKYMQLSINFSHKSLNTDQESSDPGFNVYGSETLVSSIKFLYLQIYTIIQLYTP